MLLFKNKDLLKKERKKKKSPQSPPTKTWTGDVHFPYVFMYVHTERRG